MDTKTFKHQSLVDYLSSQPGETLNKLFGHPATCLAILRALPILARHYVMRLLFVEQPVSQATFAASVKDAKKHKEATETLSNLNVWVSSPMPGGLPGWLLNSTFRESLKTALLGGGNCWSLVQPQFRDKHQPDISYLDNYAIKRWEDVLNFMVGDKFGKNQESIIISKDTIEVLRYAELIKCDDDTDNLPVITSEGFRFLLMNTRAQIWYFLVKFLEQIEEKGLDFVERLTFLFQLSFLTLGKDYSTQEMNDSLLAFLQNLRELGLVYQRKRKDGRFYPTRLAITLLSGQNDNKIDTQRSGFIIVETNYSVYGYTESPLQIALLALFTEMLYKFPKFVIGILTRDSVRQALKNGIKAAQIIKFLEMHSHPEMLKENSKLPPTVVDQIILWEKERDRFLFKNGTLYSQFNSQPEFEVLRNHASDIGALIWDNPSKRLMIVNNNRHDEVRRFWKIYKKNH